MRNKKDHLAYRAIKRRFLWFPLVGLFLLWEILYLPHLRTSPTWYGDETVTYAMARNLFHGQPAFGPYWMTYWHCYVPYLPGYLWVTGFFGFLTGDDILGARFLNTLFALGIALLIYFLGRRKFGLLPALFGAALFLTYEQNVIHFRWVYPHNAVAFGFALMTLYLLRPSRPANDWRAGAGLAIASLAHPLFAHGAIAAVACRLKRPLAWLRLAALPVAVVAITMLSISLYYWPKLWLFEDLAELMAFYRQSSEANQGGHILGNIFIFYTQDSYHLIAFLGFLLCLRRRFYPLAIVFSIITFLLLKNRSNLVQFYYQAIILAPIFALCYAGGLSTLRTWLRRISKNQENRRLEKLCFIAAFLIPFTFAAVDSVRVLSGTLTPRNQPFTTQSVPEVEFAAAWLNARTEKTDLVIANGNLSWLLKAKSAELLQSVLWQGAPTVFFDQGVKRERFRYSADISEARFLVIGDIDLRWTLQQPNIDKVMDLPTREKWPIVWQGQFYTILANPRFLEKTPTPTQE